MIASPISLTFLYNLPSASLALAYTRVYRHAPDMPKFAFLLPFLGLSGADLILCLFDAVDALKRAYFEFSFFVRCRLHYMKKAPKFRGFSIRFLIRVGCRFITNKCDLSNLLNFWRERSTRFYLSEYSRLKSGNLLILF